MFYVISQILISIGYVMYIVSRFINSKNKMLLIDNISRIVDVIGYFCLGNINGIEHTLFGIVRNEAYRHIKRNIAKLVCFVIFLIVIFCMYGIAFNGISTILFIISNIINLIGTAFGREQGVRLGTIGACLCNIPAFLFLCNYAGMIGEIVCLIMTIVALYKNHIIV